LIPFFQHDLGQAELDAIARVFAGPILTTGEEVARFEAKFADYLGRRYALGLTSCTGALHLALLACDIGPGDEVLTTPATFVATATAILSAGARPVFVDVEPDTGNIDVGLVERAITPRTKAILPVHLYGLMVDMRGLRSVADRHGLRIIEDAAHCIEGTRDGIRPGQLSDAACFSFYATKNLTCGEGGALVTDDEEIAKKVRRLRLHGIDKPCADRLTGHQHWDMVSFGWKYNMDNIQAAMLIPQLGHIDEKLRRRQRLAAHYDEKLSSISGVQRLATREEAFHARHLFPIRVPDRDRVLLELQARGISAMVNYRALSQLTYFQETGLCESGRYPAAEALGDSVLSLPFYPTMPEDHIHQVATALSAIL